MAEDVGCLDLVVFPGFGSSSRVSGSRQFVFQGTYVDIGSVRCVSFAGRGDVVGSCFHILREFSCGLACVPRDSGIPCVRNFFEFINFVVSAALPPGCQSLFSKFVRTGVTQFLMCCICSEISESNFGFLVRVNFELRVNFWESILS